MATVGDLKRALAVFSDDDELVFSGGLTYYRLKMRGPEVVQLEFNEVEGYKSEQFIRRNPHAHTVFLSFPVDSDETISGPFDATVK